MATPYNFSQASTAMDALQSEAEAARSKLRTSPTALGGAASATPYDLENQSELDKIQKSIQQLSDEKLRAQWYPPQDKSAQKEEEGPSPGFFMSGLDYLTRPLYGVVGGVKHFTGQGQGSLLEDMADNIMRNKNTMGDVLKSTGLPYGIAAPLGFALDIGLDPVNWATMGTGALIPRLAYGAVKGAKTGSVVKGLALAGKSGALEKATAIGKFTPGFRKSATFKNLADKAKVATEGFEKFAGTSAAELISKKGFNVGAVNVSRMGAGEIMGKIMDAVPGGEEFMKHFKYDPHSWVRDAQIKDVLLKAFGTKTDFSAMIAAKERGESIEDFVAKTVAKLEPEFVAKMEAMPVGPSMIDPTTPIGPIDFGPSGGKLSAEDSKKIDEVMEILKREGADLRFTEVAPKIVEDVDDVNTLFKKPKTGLTADPFENALRIAAEATDSPVTLEDIKRIVDSGALGDTGVKWFDGMMKSMRDFRSTTNAKGERIAGIGQKVMDKYDQAMGIFKISKVAASASAWTNAVVGNTLMLHMATGRISAEFMANLHTAQGFLRGTTPSTAKLLTFLMDKESEALLLGLARNETAVKGTLGADMYKATKSMEKIMVGLEGSGKIPKGMKLDELAREMSSVMSELSVEESAVITDIFASLKSDSGTAQVKKLFATKGGKVLQGDLPPGMISQEVWNNQPFIDILNKISKGAKDNPDNYAYKALDFIFNTMPSGYEKIDQSFKLASYLTSVKQGWTKNEILNIGRLVDISPEEIELGKKFLNGEWRYRIPGEKALELANVMFLNYAAMPAAVRILSKMPLVGTPFASFMYGMAIKTGQTMVYNPSAFNKVSFAMQDFGGQKTPYEKEALKGEYYSYLDKPGMFRSPWDDENPLYFNLRSMIPYYSLNMFTPSEVGFKSDDFGAKFVETVKGSSLMQEPLGATLFDYFIQPLILGEALAPQGQFGQALYPLDAGLGTKLGYGARTLAEAFVPNISSFAGVLPTPESATKYIPSYQWRSLRNAMEGKNQLGISGKESAASRAGRKVFNIGGIPVQAPMDLSFTKRENQ